MYYDWVDCNVCVPLPKNAVWFGKDTDGSDVYFGKCQIKDSVVGVKVVEQRKQAYAAYEGQEIPVINFKILINRRSEYQTWQRASNGFIPEKAIECGLKDNCKLYVGKAYHKGICIPGYINPNDQTIHISFCGKEYRYVDYEVLISHVGDNIKLK